MYERMPPYLLRHAGYVQLYPTESLLQTGRLVRLPCVLRPLRRQRTEALQQPQDAVAYHLQRPLHLRLARRRHLHEAHSIIQWYPDAIRYQRMTMRSCLKQVRRPGAPPQPTVPRCRDF